MYTRISPQKVCNPKKRETGVRTLFTLNMHACLLVIRKTRRWVRLVGNVQPLIVQYSILRGYYTLEQNATQWIAANPPPPKTHYVSSFPCAAMNRSTRATAQFICMESVTQLTGKGYDSSEVFGGRQSGALWKVLKCMPEILPPAIGDIGKETVRCTGNELAASNEHVVKCDQTATDVHWSSLADVHRYSHGRKSWTTK